jgi:hypothetical protein
VRIVSVVGTRPQLIKAAALSPALRARHDEVFVDTGQHWDEAMAGIFFAELGLPRPDHSPGIGGGGHAEQTGRMLLALEPILVAEHPDAVLVYGDTNSTLAGALAAAKLGIPVAHVEAGLRSFDRRMPEEINRVVADHLATWCFAPTPSAVSNLAAEGITRGVVEVGDLMQDLAARVVAEVRDPAVLRPIGERLGLALRPGGFIFATVHRAENRDPPRHSGRAGRRRDPPPGGRPRGGAAGLPHDARAAAPCRGGADRFGRRPARGRLAGHAVPRAARQHRVGGGGRRIRRSDGPRRARPGPGRRRAGARRADRDRRG